MLPNIIILILVYIFNSYLMILLARLLLQLNGASPHNPITRCIIQLTKWPVGFCQRFFPTMRKFDLAILITLLIVASLKFLILIPLPFHTILAQSGSIFIWSVGTIALQFTRLMIYAIFMRVIFSWISRGQSPAIEVAHYLTTAICSPLQRLIPSIGGVDLSPAVAILLLEILNRLITQQMLAIGLPLVFI